MKEVQTKPNIITNILLAAIAVILAVGIYAALERADKYLEFKARADCAAVSKHQVTIESDGVVVSYPVEDIYRKCLDEKGY